MKIDIEYFKKRISNNMAFYDKIDIVKELCEKCEFDLDVIPLLNKDIVKHAKIPVKLRETEIPFVINSIHDVIPTIDENVQKKLKYIRDLPQPAQRTDEWYAYRKNVVTASSASNIFTSDADRMKYLKEKSLPEKNFSGGGIACQFGIKFEEVAQKIFEKMTESVVSEYGCIRHETIECLGASPDGIVTSSVDPLMVGRMLEIKCLYSRELTGIPLYKYWCQCQLQMECCDLDFCDFFECKFNENMTEEEFFGKLYKNEFQTEYYGVIFEVFNRDLQKNEYIYSEISNNNGVYYRDFLNKNIEILIDDEKKDIVNITFYELTNYSKLTIKRNREWFANKKQSILEFWEEVKKTREMLENEPEKIEDIFPAKKRRRSIDSESTISSSPPEPPVELFANLVADPFADHY